MKVVLSGLNRDIEAEEQKQFKIQGMKKNSAKSPKVKVNVVT
jgi:hypothetical protein